MGKGKERDPSLARPANVLGRAVVLVAVFLLWLGVSFADGSKKEEDKAGEKKPSCSGATITIPISAELIAYLEEMIKAEINELEPTSTLWLILLVAR